MNALAEAHPDPVQPTPEVITTPRGSTIVSVGGGGYRVCDRSHHCLTAPSLWEAQQIVQWAEVHHRHLEPPHLPAAEGARRPSREGPPRR